MERKRKGDRLPCRPCCVIGNSAAALSSTVESSLASKKTAGKRPQSNQRKPTLPRLQLKDKLDRKKNASSPVKKEKKTMTGRLLEEVEKSTQAEKMFALETGQTRIG